MNFSRTFVLLGLIVILADSNSFAEISLREQKMQRVMNCLNSQMTASSQVDWQDVCYAYAQAPLPARTNWQEHYEVVNKQMDQIEYDQSQPESIVVQTSQPVPIVVAPTTEKLGFISREGTPFEKPYRQPNSWFDTNGEIQPNNSVIMSKKHQLEYSQSLYSSHYSEPKVMHQNGVLSGYRVRYTYRPPKGSLLHFRESNMYRLEGEWAKGKFNYHSDDNVIHSKGAKDVSYDLRGLVGKDFYPTATLRATPFVGFGYRYLSDKSEGLNSDVGLSTFLGYDRFSHYYYVPIGMDFRYQTKPSYSIESSFEADWVTRGYQVSKISIVPGYNDVTNKQKGGYGLRSSLRANRYLKYGAFFGEIFYRYWSIRQSEGVSDPTDPAFSLIEPKNNTNEFGLRFGVEI